MLQSDKCLQNMFFCCYDNKCWRNYTLVFNSLNNNGIQRNQNKIFHTLNVFTKCLF